MSLSLRQAKGPSAFCFNSIRQLVDLSTFGYFAPNYSAKYFRRQATEVFRLASLKIFVTSLDRTTHILSVINAAIMHMIPNPQEKSERWYPPQ